MKPIKLLLLILLIASLYNCNQSQPAKGSQTATPVAYSPQSADCPAPSSWFEQVNGVRHTPPPNEGPTSAFADNTTVSNCDFHQWSWQKFLWLTNDQNGTPLFLDSLTQVTAEGTPVTPGVGIVLRDVAQASDTSDILITNKDFGINQNGDTLYYSIHVNNLMHTSIQKYGAMYVTDSTQLAKTAFPVGALEVKISWVAADALKDPSSYFTTQGNIKGKPTQIALLGMHVVGVVENHPEFVWATFEHDNLAPAYDWSNATPSADAKVTSSINYPLFNKSDTATTQNIATQNGTYTNVFSVYRYGTPVHKAYVDNLDVLKYNETSQPGSTNYNNIRVLNDSVKSQLNDIWSNYYYNGSIWIDTEGYNTSDEQAELLDSLNFHLSNSNPGDFTRGSVSASNITMETYVQVSFSKNPTIYTQTGGKVVNCFSCHNASNNPGNFNSPLLVSHLFSGYVGTLKGATFKEVKKDHVQAIRKQFMLRKTNQ